MAGTSASQLRLNSLLTVARALQLRAQSSPGESGSVDFLRRRSLSTAMITASVAATSGTMSYHLSTVSSTRQGCPIALGRPLNRAALRLPTRDEGARAAEACACNSRNRTR